MIARHRTLEPRFDGDQPERPTRFVFERDVAFDFEKGIDVIEMIDFDFRREDNPVIRFVELDSNRVVASTMGSPIWRFAPSRSPAWARERRR